MQVAIVRYSLSNLIILLTFVQLAGKFDLQWAYWTKLLELFAFNMTLGASQISSPLLSLETAHSG